MCESYVLCIYQLSSEYAQLSVLMFMCVCVCVSEFDSQIVCLCVSVLLISGIYLAGMVYVEQRAEKLG